MNQPRAVIFDLDGTLVDTAGDLAGAMNHALSTLDLPEVPTAKVRHLVGFGAKAMLHAGHQYATGREPEDDLVEAMLEQFLPFYRDNIAVHSKVFPGVEELLGALREDGVRFAVCTNKSEALALPLLEQIGLAHWFDVIIGGDSAGVAKPDPKPVQLALKGCGIDSSANSNGAYKSIFIGDSDTDIRAAKALNMPCLIASFGYGPITERGDVHATFDDYQQAIALFRAALGLT